MNFPSQHPLNQTESARPADRQRRRHPRPRADRLLGHGVRVPRCAAPHVAVAHQAGHAAHQHHRRRSLHEEQLPGLPALPGSGRRDGRRRRGHAAGADRGVPQAGHRGPAPRVRGAARRGWTRRTRAARRRRAPRRRMRWDASPISTARLAAEIWAQIRNEDWSLVSESGNSSGWAFRLWDFDKHYQHLGDSGGAASATARRRPWAARWPTRSTAGCR